MKRLLLLALAGVAAFAQNAALMPMPKLQFFDGNGVPLAGGSIYTYAAGTNNPLATFTDSTGGTPNQNPVPLDSAGRASIWIGSSSYKVIAQDQYGVIQWTQDNVSSTAIATGVSLTSNGASLIKWTAPNGTARTVAAKLGDYISLLDYGALCDGVTDDTAAFQRALAAAQAAGKPLYTPDGLTCLIGPTTTSGNLFLRGFGTLKLYSTSIYPSNFALLTVNGGTVNVADVTFDQNMTSGTATGSWTDGTEPVATNGYFYLRVNNSTNVELGDVVFQNMKRGVLLNSSSHVSIHDCTGMLQGSATTNLIALDNVTDIEMHANRFYGDTWDVNPTTYSVNGLLGWNVNSGHISGNIWKGFQIVLRSVNPYVLPAGQATDLTFSDNVVDTPVADTALVGFYKVVAIGNRIRQSGDMGLTFDNSSYVTSGNNFIESPHTGCMNISGAVSVTATGNICRNPARAYAQWNAIRAPSFGGSWMSCMTVSLNTGALGVSSGVTITGNSCWMDVLPPVTDGLGQVRSRVGGIMVDPTTSTPSQVVISNNFVYADETNMPNFFIAAPTAAITYSAVTGTPRAGELFKSTAGNQFRLVTAVNNFIWMRDYIGFPLGNEVYTGQSSSATLTIAAAIQPGFQGVYFDHQNHDYITAAVDSYRGSNVLVPNAFNTAAPTVAFGDPNTGISSESSGALDFWTKTRGGTIKLWGNVIDRASGAGYGGGGSLHDLAFDAPKGGSWYYLRGISSYLGSQSIDFWFDSNGVLSMPALKSNTGVRYACFDTTGKLVSQTSACSGT
jgi:hypothetical protein